MSPAVRAQTTWELVSAELGEVPSADYQVSVDEVFSEFKKGLETVANGGTYFGPGVAALLRNVVANNNPTLLPFELAVAPARRQLVRHAVICQVGVELLGAQPQDPGPRGSPQHAGAARP